MEADDPARHGVGVIRHATVNLLAAESLDQSAEVRRQRCLEVQHAAVAWMLKRQSVGVKRLARKLDRSQRLRPVHVTPFANARVTAQPRLDADLVALVAFVIRRRAPRLVAGQTVVVEPGLADGHDFGMLDQFTQGRSQILRRFVGFGGMPADGREDAGVLFRQRDRRQTSAS